MEYKLLLLGLLRNQQMHGYQLYEFLDNNLGICVQLKKPTAYKYLNQMSDDGWIRYTLEAVDNRPTRRVYEITAAGEQAFQTMLRESLAHYQTAEYPSSISLMFLDIMPPDEALPLLEQRLEMVTRLRQEVDGYPPHHGSVQLMIDHQRHHLDAEIVWLNDVIHYVLNKQS